MATTHIPLTVRFSAEIERFEDTASVAGWFIGYKSLGTIDEETGGFLRPPRYPMILELEGEQSESAWLESFLRTTHDMQGSPNATESVRRWLARTGTFRDFDWQSVETVLQTQLPDEVKAEIKRAKVSKKEPVYLLRESDFWNELELLRTVARITGKIADGKPPLTYVPLLQTGENLFHALRRNDPPSPKLIEIGRELNTMSTYGVSANRKEPAASHKQWALSRLPAPELRRRVEWLIDTAFQRGIGKSHISFRFRSGSAPGMVVKVRSLLGLAYSILLSDFAEPWRLCKRPGCGNLFIYRGRGKQYCEWYCAHLHGMQRRRQTLARRGKKSPNRKKR
jgi:hypothetical protein